MANYIKCPDIANVNSKKIFLAGTISGCPNWQEPFAKSLISLPSNWDIVNPRRDIYDDKNLTLAKSQIEWEYKHLCQSDFISFWFDKSTYAPITLFELGWAIAQVDKLLFIGVDPLYARKLDVQVQVELRRPKLEIVDNLDDLQEQIIKATK